MAAEKVILLDLFASMFGMTARVALSKRRRIRIQRGGFAQQKPASPPIQPRSQKKSPFSSTTASQFANRSSLWTEKSPLLPSDPYQRAQARFGADYIDKKLYGVGRKIWTTKEEELEEGKKGFLEILKQLEAEMGEKQFFGGESLGFVDVALVTYSLWFHTYKTCGNFSIEEHCPKLVAWLKRCLEIESVSKPREGGGGG